MLHFLWMNHLLNVVAVLLFLVYLFRDIITRTIMFMEHVWCTGVDKRKCYVCGSLTRVASGCRRISIRTSQTKIARFAVCSNRNMLISVQGWTNVPSKLLTSVIAVSMLIFSSLGSATVLSVRWNSLTDFVHLFLLWLFGVLEINKRGQRSNKRNIRSDPWVIKNKLLRISLPNIGGFLQLFLLINSVNLR